MFYILLLIQPICFLEYHQTELYYTYFCKCYLTLFMCLLQELEALRSQVQSQSAEINQMKTERQELLRRAEAEGVNIVQI